MSTPAQQAVYTKTAKGILEIRNKSAKLSRELGSVFQAVDGKATVADIAGKSGMTGAQLQGALNTLVTDGYIKIVAAAAPPSVPDGVIDVDPDPSAAAASRLNMEAATHALASAEAAKLAQQEGRAALEARLRADAESRARALAEVRAQSEAEAHAKAEAAARAAANDRAQAEQDASFAPDAAARADAEARMRTAAAAAVRAQAEARTRADAEARARAVVDDKKAAEGRALEEAQRHAAGEEHAQARAAAETRAHDALQAHLEAVTGAREHGDAAPSRALLQEREDMADRARAEAKALAPAQGTPQQAPAPGLQFDDRARELTARVNSERRARDEAERRTPAPGTPGSRSSTPEANSFPSLHMLRDEASEPAEGEAPASTPEDAEFGQDLPTISLASTTGRGDVKHVTPDHVPSALERVMMATAARAEAEAIRNGDAPAAPRASSGAAASRTPPAAPVHRPAAPPEPPAAPESPLALVDDAAPTPEFMSTMPSTPAASGDDDKDGGGLAATIDDSDSPHERLNDDRKMHDVLAESAIQRRNTAAITMAREADLQHQRKLDDERRAAFEARETRRKKTARTAGVVAVAIPALAIAWLQFMPLNGYISEAQQALSERLNQPATISRLRYVLFPTPRVVLEGVGIGVDQGIRVERLDALAWPTTFMGGGPPMFDTVEASGVTVDTGMLGAIPAWTGGRSANAVHVSRLKLADVKLAGAGNAKIEGLGGEVTFAPNGTVKQAVLNNESLKLEITPQASGMRVMLDAHDWQPPFGPAVPFTYLTLDGIADKQHYATTALSGRIAGGSFTGTLAARWDGPIIVGGDLKLQSARLEDLTQLMAADFRAKGALDASGRYAMQADSASALMQNPLLEGTFTVMRGELPGIDLARAVQSPGSAVRGRTPFESLKGSIQASGHQFSYRNLQLSSGPLEATGSVDVAAGGQLSGRIAAQLSARSGVVARGNFTVTGTVKEPAFVR